MGRARFLVLSATLAVGCGSSGPQGPGTCPSEIVVLDASATAFDAVGQTLANGADCVQYCGTSYQGCKLLSENMVLCEHFCL
jgi:hypothetical protein